MRRTMRYAGMAAILIAVGLCAWYLESSLAGGPGRPAGAAGALQPTTFCPPATPEMLWVDPVDSPTGCQSQQIRVIIGNGEYVSGTSESGTFEVTGTFSVHDPAVVTMPLLPGATHHLLVAGRVRVVWQGDCQYGGYTLFTSSDRFGAPLVIVQEGDECARVLLPLVLKPAMRE